MHELLIAQALVEHGLLSSIAASFTRMRYEIDAYLGHNATYLVFGVLVLLLFLVVRRRR